MDAPAESVFQHPASAGLLMAMFLPSLLLYGFREYVPAASRPPGASGTATRMERPMGTQGLRDRFRKLAAAVAVAAVGLLALRQLVGVVSGRWVGAFLGNPLAAPLGNQFDSYSETPFSGSQLDFLNAIAVPTLGEWGMLFATLSLLAAGTSVIVRRRRR